MRDLELPDIDDDPNFWAKDLNTPPPEDLGYIVKPFTGGELKSEIERLIG